MVHVIALIFLMELTISSAKSLKGSTKHENGASSEKNTVYDVIIVGAGWAGLGAANYLKDSDVTNFLVLEARDYVGGRSVTSFELGPDKPVELGSEWIQGTDIKKRKLRYIDNPVFNAAEEANVPLGITDPKAAFYRSNGERFTDAEANSLQEKYWDGFMNYIDERSDRVDIDIRSAADDFIAKKNIPSGDTGEGFFEMIIDKTIVQDYAGDLSETSLYNWNIDTDVSGPDMILTAPGGGGYSSVVNSYAEPVLSNIQLQSKVTTVDYFDDTVLVTYTDEQNISSTIQSKKVILTLPIGVLKAGQVEFKPPFSSSEVGIRKQNAIDHIGSGVLNRCAFYWEDMTDSEVFWPKDRQWLDFIATDVTLQGRWTEWYNPYSINGRKTILEGFSAGNDGVDIESLSDAEITAEALAQLRTIFGTDNVPDPTSAVISRWNQDEFSRGSYSFMQVGATRDTRYELSESIDYKLYFAGEATNSKSPATTHGALCSGRRAARYLLDIGPIGRMVKCLLSLVGRDRIGSRDVY